jgi:predicted nuclease of restriction endonuclease-like (RecB) superfamily
MAKKKTKAMHVSAIRPKKMALTAPLSSDLLDDLRQLIANARGAVAQVVNSALVQLYWRIGQRISRDILQDQRADYGKQILSTLSKELVAEFGSGYDPTNVSRMVKFAECYSDPKIVVTLSQQLSWIHFIAILPVTDELARDFYAEMCRIERWSVRTLRAKIGSMLFERTALSKKPKKLAAQELQALRDEDLLTPDLVFRDPYFLDFLGLKDVYSEADLEAAVLRELEAFILELGVGFTFVARQFRIIVDGEDYHLDLLFYHRRLRRLVALDLKLEKFRPADKGQMELYLRWLEKHAMEPGEEKPLGLILCAGKSDEQIELMQLAKSGIRVASYLTELPPRELLTRKLHDAVRTARARLGQKSVETA